MATKECQPSQHFLPCQLRCNGSSSNSQYLMELLTTERASNNTVPLNGCHEPGCPLPMMPEEVFILFTMLYLSIILILTFYAFSWFNL